MPVVKHGNRVKQVEACVQSSRFWQLFTILKLETNMRVSDNDDNFRSWLLSLGNGTLETFDKLGEDIIEIPEHFIENGDILDSIFGKKLYPNQSHEFQDKAILCPTNKEVHRLNLRLLNRLEGEMRTYKSADSIVLDENVNPTDYPMEFLNGLTPSGTPLHELNLKVGAIIMLMRNLNSQRGLCNGTRLVVESMLNNLIIAKVLTGKAKGNIVFIPRIDIVPSDTDLPFQLKRRQFPVMLAFVMTINKSQGQSLDSVGIYLENPVFSHGQLYVAFSRARSKDKVKVKVLKTFAQGKLIRKSNRVFTKNIVYKEVFDRSAFQEQHEERFLSRQMDVFEHEENADAWFDENMHNLHSQCELIEAEDLELEEAMLAMQMFEDPVEEILIEDDPPLENE